MSQDQQQDRHEIQLAITQLTEAINAIRRTQQTLTQEMTALAGTWKGNASTAFAKAHQAFDAKFTETIKELNRIRDILQESLKDYTVNEAAQEAESQSIFNVLNF